MNNIYIYEMRLIFFGIFYFVIFVIRLFDFSKIRKRRKYDERKDMMSERRGKMMNEK